MHATARKALAKAIDGWVEDEASTSRWPTVWYADGPNPHDPQYRCRYVDETEYAVEEVEYFT